ncbi:hypothetical protein BC940DRAFT_291991 [Gongronella butleri]|nr:hypothetical protein BC940DRAFT_291991 [Gongronella butleri]
MPLETSYPSQGYDSSFLYESMLSNSTQGFTSMYDDLYVPNSCVSGAAQPLMPVGTEQYSMQFMLQEVMMPKEVPSRVVVPMSPMSLYDDGFQQQQQQPVAPVDGFYYGPSLSVPGLAPVAAPTSSPMALNHGYMTSPMSNSTLSFSPAMEHDDNADYLFQSSPTPVLASPNMNMSPFQGTSPCMSPCTSPVMIHMQHQQQVHKVQEMQEMQPLPVKDEQPKQPHQEKANVGGQHSVIRPTPAARLQCSECSRTFTRQYNLKSHMVVHEGKKPYDCSYCHLSFARPHDLRRHTRVHENDYQHPCAYCPEKFYRSDALNRHIKKSKACSEKMRADPKHVARQTRRRRPNKRAAAN